MYSKDIGKYLGCGLILFIGIYVVYAVMVKPTESRQEGFTSERKTLDSTLDMLRNQSKNLEGKVRIDKNREVWQDILVQMEDNVNLATLDQIQNCKMDGGVPAIGCDSMNNILEYNKFKGGLKQLDDFLDSYKGH